MNQLPPLNGLRAFDVAGRHLNFRAAAEDLGVTQGAIAQQVRQLEAYLGLRLFERLPKGLAFTAAGRSYHAHISSAFEDLRTATANLRPQHSKVVVSVTPTFAAKWLIPNLADFSAKHPQIDLQILATERVSSFHGDGIDVAIRQGRPSFGASLDATLLFRQEIIAVAAPTFIAGYDLPLDAEALSKLPKLHDTHDLWPAFLKELKAENRSGHGLRLSQTALTVDAALSGQGVALVSSFLVKQDIAAKNLVQLIPYTLSGKQDFYILSLQSSKRNMSVQAVVNWFIERAETD